MVIRHLKLASPDLSKGLELEHTLANGGVERRVYSENDSVLVGVVCGHMLRKGSALSWARCDSHCHSPERFPPSRPELISQVRQLWPWIPQGMCNQVTSPKLGLVGLRCSVLVSLLWKYISADMAQRVRWLTAEAEA